MKILATVFVFMLFTGFASHAVAENDELEVGHVRVRRGFGCPLNQAACHNHCRSIGRRGGYCAGLVKQTCTCYKS
ncbi:4 kDa defensin-like [Dermacentor albipictus]|uniref:4 kDa defensin-like n=1 Tax=Dermacentor albipictus TaxID=60249 RepID=UPI0031FC7FFA